MNFLWSFYLLPVNSVTRKGFIVNILRVLEIPKNRKFLKTILNLLYIWDPLELVGYNQLTPPLFFCPSNLMVFIKTYFDILSGIFWRGHFSYGIFMQEYFCARMFKIYFFDCFWTIDIVEQRIILSKNTPKIMLLYSVDISYITAAWLWIHFRNII